jgi:hypothetical protein
MASYWEPITALATLAAAICAVVAAALSLRAIRATQNIAVEQRADDSVKKYLELSLQHPEVSTLKCSDEDKEDWLVTFMLLMAKNVMQAHPLDKNWRQWVTGQLSLYRESLDAWKADDKEHGTNYLNGFGPDVEKLVDEVIRKEKRA